MQILMQILMPGTLPLGLCRADSAFQLDFWECAQDDDPISRNGLDEFWRTIQALNPRSLTAITPATIPATRPIAADKSEISNMRAVNLRPVFPALPSRRGLNPLIRLLLLEPVRRGCSWMLAVLSSVERRCRVLRTSVATLPHDSAKSCHKFRSRTAQFVVMMQGQFGEHFFSLEGKREEDFAAIVLSPLAMDKSSSLQTVH
jgi:hypothetical protein